MTRRTASHWAVSSEPAAPDLDVLIPSCERPAELAVTLAGLAAQDSPDFDITISDQSPKEPDWDNPVVASMIRVLQAQGHRVRLERHLPRKGMAEHRQFLLNLASAPQILFLDNDVWLEPGALATLCTALVELRCGFVGMAVQGLSYLNDLRPEELSSFEAWAGPVVPERIRRDKEAFRRWPLHNAANLTHQSAVLGLAPEQWLSYRIAWLGGCVVFDRQALLSCGGYDFWPDLPTNHSGEDVAAQWRVMEQYGGAGILPSAAVHLESPTSIADRRVDAFDVVFPREP